MINEVLKRAKVQDLTSLEQTSNRARRVCEECKDRAKIALDALLATGDDRVLSETRTTVANLETFASLADVVGTLMPTGKYITRDTRVIAEGRQAPPHLQAKCKAASLESPKVALENLSRLVRNARMYLGLRMNMKGKPWHGSMVQYLSDMVAQQCGAT